MTSLAPAQEPHILSNQALSFVAEKSAHSVFSVRVCPRSELGEDGVRDAIEALDKLLRRLGHDNIVDFDDIRPRGYSKATGFSIGQAKDYLTILTVSHIIDEVYYADRHLTAGAADPSSSDTLETINEAFSFDVLCVHQERLLKESNVEDISTLTRWHASAVVVAIDTRRDLLALKCSIKAIGGDENNEPCPHHHGSSLAIADLAPSRSETVLLQGWPYLLSDFQWWGRVSVNERPYNTVDRTNEYGYQMKLIEIPRMKCVSECSGGPVVVGAMTKDQLCFIGVYFKTMDNSGYAVSHGDIKVFLTQFGLLDDAHDVHAAYEHVRENNRGDHSGGEEKGKSTE